MDRVVTLVLSVLVVTVIFLQWLISRSRTQTLEVTHDFQRFQRKFIIPYLLALFSDWLQGPYVYRLYSQYGYTPSQIAALYIVGFAASVSLGTCMGSVADLFGRKRVCLIFCISYSVCCLTKLSSNFWWLALGRVFGGMSTSVLNSTFESWYVSQHSEGLKYPAEWISNTLSITTFWNGVLAIAAGILADFAAEWTAAGPVAPFLLAVPCLLACGGFIYTSWEENYGSRHFDCAASSREGLRAILSDQTVLLLGATQSMFESIMYIFVFLWTPILEPPTKDLITTTALQWPLGLVFSSFMVCIMIGSSLHAYLTSKGVSQTTILQTAMLLALVSMFVCCWSSSSLNQLASVASFCSFLLLEVSVGLYFPSVGFLKSQVIPDSLRASIMNWFRVPMNVIICLVLATKSSANHFVFTFCCLMALVGFLTCRSFTRRYSARSEARDKLYNASMKEKVYIL